MYVLCTSTKMRKRIIVFSLFFLVINSYVFGNTPPQSPANIEKNYYPETCILTYTYRRNKTHCQLTPLEWHRFNGSIKHGGVIQFNCLDGYKLVGNEYLHCRNGVFLEKPPRCFANCESSISIVNGQYTGRYTHGGSITFTCDVGYTLVGETTISCDNGQYSSSYAECKANCESSISIRNGQYSGSSTHGGSMTFTCDAGYTLVGETTITCDNGQYSSSYPKCMVLPVVDSYDYRAGQGKCGSGPVPQFTGVC
ncbi:membrane cofactor protein-like isoform X2 [Antedon mediterranea]|uniref:membrane cofactor protein-like isoform X2 n=1 Tax=Antedon mediterranea TaxID=105859 RepID=UPI003AF73DB9